MITILKKPKFKIDYNISILMIPLLAREAFNLLPMIELSAESSRIGRLPAAVSSIPQNYENESVVFPYPYWRTWEANSQRSNQRANVPRGISRRKEFDRRVSTASILSCKMMTRQKDDREIFHLPSHKI